MTTEILNDSKSETIAFQSRGDLCVSAKGKGSIQILREMGGEFLPITDNSGMPLIFGADGGLAVNATFSCNVRRNYKIKATGEMTVSYYPE